jgi:hypothetical protein
MHGKPHRAASNKPSPRKRVVQSAVALTATALTKDTLSSVLARNVVQKTPKVMHAVNALVAASDAMTKIHQSMDSDERKRILLTPPNPRKS